MLLPLSCFDSTLSLGTKIYVRSLAWERSWNCQIVNCGILIEVAVQKYQLEHVSYYSLAN